MAKRKKGNGKKRRSLWKRAVCLLAALGLTAAAAVAAFVACVYHGAWGKVPGYEELREIRQHEASSLYSEDGELLGKYYLENRTEVLFGSLSPKAVEALVATEDSRFYEHHGVDKISLLRVLLKTILLGDKREGGGSTISQQLAKNLYPRETGKRWMLPVAKVKEMIVAHRLESIYTKDEILTLYLNTVWFGEGAYGIESAAQQYFSTTATQLSATEAATLIGLLKGPSLYNPRLHPERALEKGWDCATGRQTTTRGRPPTCGNKSGARRQESWRRTTSGTGHVTICTRADWKSPRQSTRRRNATPRRRQGSG